MSDGFFEGFTKQQLSPQGWLGGELDDVSQRRKNKLTLQLKSAEIEAELNAKMAQAYHENMLKGQPSDQFGKAIKFGQGDESIDPSSISDPETQSMMGGFVRPILGNKSKNVAYDLKNLRSDADLIPAVLKNPELYDALPGAVKARITPKLSEKGFTYLGKPLSAELLKVSENAQSGLRRLEDVEGFLKNPTALAELAIPGAPTQRKLKAAFSEIEDVISRLRTGAAINDKELEFYHGQLPGLLDAITNKDQDAINYKLSLFRELFQGMSTRQKTAIVKDPKVESGYDFAAEDSRRAKLKGK